MRLCHVSPHLPPDQAANAILPASLGAWATAAGHTVTFVTQEPAQGRSVLHDLPGAVRRVAAQRSDAPLARALRVDAWRRARAIVGALDELARDADLLHLHSNGLIIEVSAAWARRRRKPFVLTLYGTEIWHYRRRWPLDPFTRAYRNAGEVTFYSRRLHERARAIGLDRHRASVIYPPVGRAFVTPDAATRDRWRRELGITERLVVLNVKRLHDLAGQRFLVEAFSHIARERHDVRLVICGTGPLRAELAEQTRTAGIADRTTFTGLVSNDDVARYAAVADIFVLPSLLEALPTVAVEALATGTPVISADHPGGFELNEIFGDDVEMVPRQDAPALATALAAALAHPRRTTPTTAERLVRHFSPEAVETAYSAVYRRLTGDR